MISMITHDMHSQLYKIYLTNVTVTHHLNIFLEQIFEILNVTLFLTGYGKQSKMKIIISIMFLLQKMVMVATIMSLRVISICSVLLHKYVYCILLRVQSHGGIQGRKRI